VIAGIVVSRNDDSGLDGNTTVAAEKALALVLRTTDWSETSRIATLWTREFGKVRVLAKGGRRLKSNFETALDLLTVCSIVFLRKSSGGLDLLTEAQVVKRFPRLRGDLPALYAGYYIVELLSDLTEEYDPHPTLFDEALRTLESLGTAAVATGPWLARFELVLLRELGYSPALTVCAACAVPLPPNRPGGLAFSPAGGGVLCPVCQTGQRDRKPLSLAGWQALLGLAEPGEGWQKLAEQVVPGVRKEIRQVLNQYMTYLLGRQPRLLPYLGS
jgi:DNA repair protein RecO (recombination protein O)